MSNFKVKPTKAHINNEITTLDQTHKIKANNFKSRKLTLDKKKARVIECEKQLESLNNTDASNFNNNDYIFNRSKLKSEINTLKYEINDIENDVSEIEYYNLTEEYLMDYYESFDNMDIYDNEDGTIIKKAEEKEDKMPMFLQSTEKSKKKVTRRRKRKVVVENTVNILDYLQKPSPKIENGEIKVKKNRNELFNNYKIAIDPEYRGLNNKKYFSYSKCEDCDRELILIQNDGINVCEECGYACPIIIESEKPNYKDINSEKPGYPYKRSNHFNEWLAQFQAKSSTEIPKEVYDVIFAESKKNRIYNFNNVKKDYIKEILKRHKFTQYYEHIPLIIYKLNGKPPPTLTRETEELLKNSFKEIQEPFELYKPPSRVNFLSYSYVLRKLCELHEFDEFIECFSFLKTKEHMRDQDMIWKKICKHLGWKFYPSV